MICQVLDVKTEQVGSLLLQAATAGDSVLYVTDITTFADTGNLIIGAETVGYTKYIDDDNDIERLDLSTALANSYVIEEPVYVSPIQNLKILLVTDGEIEHEIEANSGLWTQLTDGPRDEGTGEFVLVENGRAVSLVGQVPQIQGDYLDSTTQTKITNGDTAYAKVNDIADDNKLTPVEKQDIKREWDVIVSEKTILDTQASVYGITTERTNYDDSFQTLANYLNNGTTWTTGTPTWLADLTTTQTIVGSTFRSTFSAYYTAKTNLINKIRDTANLAVQSYGANLIRNADGANYSNHPTAGHNFDNWIENGISVTGYIQRELYPFIDGAYIPVFAFYDTDAPTKTTNLVTDAIKINPNKMYLLEGWFRREDTNGLAYYGIEQTVNGVDVDGNGPYILANIGVPVGQWTYYSGYIMPARTKAKLTVAYVSGTDTTVTVDDITGFPTSGAAYIGDKQFNYTGISGNQFTGVTNVSVTGTQAIGTVLGLRSPQAQSSVTSATDIEFQSQWVDTIRVKVYAAYNSPAIATGRVAKLALREVGTTAIDGFNVIIGSLSASVIYGDTLTLGGSGNANGILNIKDASGNIIVAGDSTGLLVDGGFYKIIDKGLTSSVAEKQNVIYDHSFEGVIMTGSRDATYNDYAVTLKGNWYEWLVVGSPRLLNWSSLPTAQMATSQVMGSQAIIVNSTNYFKSQNFRDKIKDNTAYYLSCHYAKGFRSTTSSKLRINAKVYDATNVQLGSTITADFTPDASNFVWKRGGVLIPATVGAAYVVIEITAPDSNYIYADGIQLVEGTVPCVYDPEHGLMRHTFGTDGSDYSVHKYLSILTGLSLDAGSYIAGSSKVDSSTGDNLVCMYGASDESFVHMISTDVNVAFSNASSAYTDFTFANGGFVTAILSAVATPIDSSSFGYASSIYNRSKTGCRVYLRHIDETVYTWTIKVTVLAIGH